MMPRGRAISPPPGKIVYAAVRSIGVTRPVPSASDGTSGSPDSPALLASRSTGDRKSTRLNSSHVSISYAVFCLKKKKHSSPLNNALALVRQCAHPNVCVNLDVFPYYTRPSTLAALDSVTLQDLAFVQLSGLAGS